ncbi:hypothetical protein DRQ09_08430 [candidate division KSB1 bacterium]|nr:MAG: hypothetical protein DRQ09_08430 [candidate division KSB1 bacterium]
MKRLISYFSVVLLFLFSAETFAQKYPWAQKSILPMKIIDAIANEVSGKTAHNHAIVMAGFNRNRFQEEYTNNYFETDYVYKKALEYGFDEVTIEKFKSPRKQWDGEMAELWEISPKHRKIADYDDMTALLASGSITGEYEGDLIYVGMGTIDEFEGKDVRGKILLTCGSGSRALMIGLQKGAIGVISFSNIHPMDDVDQVAWHGIRVPEGKKAFGFNFSYRAGFELMNRLYRGENIRLKAKVKTRYYPGKMEVVVATINGREKPDEEVVYTAHLFEGVTKQGANDNISGCCVLLEIGRTIKKLINDGIIKRPRRTLRFLFVPEISGTIAYLNRYPEKIKGMLVNINLDMVGEYLIKNKASMNLQTTPYSRPSYLNDVLESFYEFVGESNRESLNTRSAFRFSYPLIDPYGSLDPFYYKIETYYGASDHIVFNTWGVNVPAVMMIDWPDLTYHSSVDRPENMDPTQLKRVSFIATAAGLAIADADDFYVLNMAADISARGYGRIAYQFRRAVELLTDAKPDELAGIYKHGENLIKIGALREKETLNSLKELISPGSNVNDYIDSYCKDVDSILGSFLEKYKKHYSLLADFKGVPVVFPELTVEEKEADKIIPRPTEKVKGYFQYSWIRDKVSSEEITKLTHIRRNVTWELRNLINGERSVLQIKNILNAEYSLPYYKPIKLKDVMDYLKLLEKAELITM